MDGWKINELKKVDDQTDGWTIKRERQNDRWTNYKDV